MSGGVVYRLIPLVVRYFTDEGAQVKILEFSSVPGETSNILVDEISRSLRAFNLVDKVVGFCADNTNTNFGGKARAGVNNVFFKLNELSTNELFGVGCAAHIVHNALQSAADTLPCDVEAFIVKIFGHFHIYTVRTEQLKEFCDFVELEYAAILGTSKTRWLSLGPAVERVLKLYPALKSYFASQDRPPVTITQFLKNPLNEAWLWFLHCQLSLFSDTVKALEKQRNTAAHSALHLRTLRQKLEERRQLSSRV